MTGILESYGQCKHTWGVHAALFDENTYTFARGAATDWLKLNYCDCQEFKDSINHRRVIDGKGEWEKPFRLDKRVSNNLSDQQAA